MYRPRIIPVLLLKNQVLVKSVRFRNHAYIGDPINAVRIFNDSKADELVFLDISATNESRIIDLDFVKSIGEEANMPFAVGGGICSIEDIQSILAIGAEKVIINTYAAKDPGFIRKASETFGSSTITVCIDVKKKLFNGLRCMVNAGSKTIDFNPIDFSKLMEANGAGEIIIQSIDRDGTMSGYDLSLINEISKAVKIPVIALGGAGNIDDLRKGYQIGNANGLAAGSMFVYMGPHKGVLINYPERSQLIRG